MKHILAHLLTAALAAGKITLDHIVYVVPDLHEAIDDIESRLGVRPSIGGKHKALGTHNALLGLGDGRYLELFAPDPDATTTLKPLIGVDSPNKPRVSTFCCDAGSIGIDTLTSQLAAAATAAKSTSTGEKEEEDADLFPANPEAGSRRNEDDNSLVSWKVAVDKHAVPYDKLPMGGLLPFLIEWDPDCLPARPATRAPSGCRLVKMVGYHPNPERLKKMLQTMGAEDVLQVEEGPEPKLILFIKTPNNGIVELQ